VSRDVASMSQTDRAGELGRLRWQSRRGMKELDRLFERYLDTRWPTASDDERREFERLLACEDPFLWRWFMGYEVPQDAGLAVLVEKIRTA